MIKKNVTILLIMCLLCGHGNMLNVMAQETDAQESETLGAESIRPKNRWVTENGKEYFADPDGNYYKNRFISFGPDTRYYMGADGSKQKGVTLASDGKLYNLDVQSGVLQRKAGWIDRDGKRCFSSEEGIVYANRFISFGKTYYYCGADGAIIRNTKDYPIQGVLYSFDENGIMIIEGGWREYNGNRYFKNPETGFPYRNQFISFGPVRHYMNAGGFMLTGWQFINGKWYYLSGGADDPVKTGWQNPMNYYQVSSETVRLPSDYTGFFTYVSPSRISINATREECIEAFISRAYDYLGTPYKWGYSCAPGVGIDCSGLVMQALYATGMNTAYNPYIHPDQEDTTGKMCSDPRFKHVSLQDRQRGDIIFYPGHTAIYLGNNQVINARGSRGVIIESIWIKEIVGVVRPFTN